MSDNAYDAIKAFPEFITEPRGVIHIKVKYKAFLNKRCFSFTYFQNSRRI